MVIKLGLSEDQVKTIEALSRKHCTAMIRLDADLKIAHLEMQELLGSGASDSDIKSKAKAVSSLRRKIEDAQLDHMLECRKQLTAEQQKKLKSACPMMHGPGMMDCRPGGQCQPAE
jgi:Spy/CpxP family protein refolding chaperone